MTYNEFIGPYICHHGILGQKWGVRRFQNTDGSLTEEGKKRYHSTNSRLSKYSQEDISNDTIAKYKSQAKQLSHVRVNKDSKGKIFTDKGKLVGMVNTEKKSDGNTWIQGVELFGESKGKGLSYDMLDYATKELGATHLSVNRSNKVAKHVYDKYGFEEYDSDDSMVYMKLKRRKK